MRRLSEDEHEYGSYEEPLPLNAMYADGNDYTNASGFYSETNYLCSEDSVFRTEEVVLETNKHDCLDLCEASTDDDAFCVAFEANSTTCTLFNLTCFERNRPLYDNRTLHLAYSRTPQMYFRSQETAAMQAMNYTYDTVSTGTIFVGVDRNYDGLLSGEEIYKFIFMVRVNGSDLALKGSLVTGKTVDEDIMQPFDTREPYNLIDYAEFDYGMTQDIITDPDTGALTISRLRENLVYLVLGFPARSCESLTSPGAPPPPEPPPCAPPPPATCGPWEDAAGYNTGATILVAAGFDSVYTGIVDPTECASVCCDLEFYGCRGFMWNSATGECTLTSENPAYPVDDDLDTSQSDFTSYGLLTHEPPSPPGLRRLAEAATDVPLASIADANGAHISAPSAVDGHTAVGGAFGGLPLAGAVGVAAVALPALLVLASLKRLLRRKSVA